MIKKDQFHWDAIYNMIIYSYILIWILNHYHCPHHQNSNRPAAIVIFIPWPSSSSSSPQCHRGKISTGALWIIRDSPIKKRWYKPWFPVHSALDILDQFISHHWFIGILGFPTLIILYHIHPCIIYTKSIISRYRPHWPNTPSNRFLPSSFLESSVTPRRTRPLVSMATEKNKIETAIYSYGHLLVITGYKWDYTFCKWG